MKICTKCQLQKPLSDYYANAESLDGKMWHCKICDKAYAKNYNAGWYIRNLEYQKAKSRSWYSKNKAWVIRRIYLYNKSKPHISAEAEMRRRARKRLATPKWADISKMQEVYRQSAEITKLTGISHNVDHIVPLQGKSRHGGVCGLHCHFNLQVLTGIENSKKNNIIWPDMWDNHG